ncbi:unnamed protein product [Orchesella dallaii]|uniref:RNA-directed DNA polymerase n=1 Tax=Orchesella dallaii TaxID=48710 RepID=A0ABP1RKE4_9HEXA
MNNHSSADCRKRKRNKNNTVSSATLAHSDEESDNRSTPEISSAEQNTDFMGSFVLTNQANQDKNTLPTLPVNYVIRENNVKRTVKGKCLVDTGASVSVIGDINLLNNNPIKTWTKGKIKLADGSTATPTGKVTFKFRLGTTTFTHIFVIMPNCDFAMLLGMDFLRNSGMIIDLAKMKFWFQNTPKPEKYKFQTTDARNSNIRALQLLDDWQRDEINKILKQYPTVVDSPTLGHTSVVEHEINVTDDKPKQQKPFPVSDAKHQIIDKIVESMLQQGLISESNSPYSSPVIIRPKPSGDHRLVNDYRYVNQLTVPDGFPMRKITDVMRLLSEATHLTTIDLEKGFWQVKLRECDKKYTAFRTRKGLYQYNVMPQGLKNSPATFQRLMNKVLKGMDAFVFVYQDDILIFSKNFDDHLLHIQQVLNRLKSANLTVSSSKCHFGREKVKFLGHIISTEGIQRNPEKVTAVLAIPTPRTRRQLRSFLGAIGWFRHFLPQMADIAHPLYELLSGKKKFTWSAAAQEAMHNLKTLVSEDVMLHHPNFNKEFVLQTDAANNGVGAVLLQTDLNDMERPIAFASKSFTKSQLNYSTVEKECYAIIFALDKFSEYLDGASFSIKTDNQAITYLNSMKNSNSKLMRWAMKIQEWCPSITHIKGRDNVVADFLSRNPVDDTEEEACLSINTLLTLTCDLDKKKLKQEQDKDSKCKTLLLSHPDRFCDLNGIIYKKLKNKKVVPVIPESLQSQVLHNLHDHPSAGHLGAEKTFTKLKSHAYFQGMRKFTDEYIKTCDVCQRNKYDNKRPAGLMGTKPITSPWHTIYVDLMGPYTPSSPNRFSYVLVAVDGFTKFVELHPLRDATAKSIANVLEKELFCRYGVPRIIVTDNATSFRSEIFGTLCKTWGIRHSFSSPYHPQTNLSERVNRVVKPMIRCYLDDSKHSKWSEKLSLFQLAINTSKHDSTGFAPATVLFNTNPRLPIDNKLSYDSSLDDDLVEDDADDDTNLIQSRFSQFLDLQEKVKENLAAATNKQKAVYDQSHRPEFFQIGDLVSLKTTTLSNKEKKISAGLCSLFQKGPATITKIISERTFEVRLPDGSTRGPIHINLLRRYHPREVPANTAPSTPALPVQPTPASSQQPDGPITGTTARRTLRPRQPVNYKALHHGIPSNT